MYFSVLVFSGHHTYVGTLRVSWYLNSGHTYSIGQHSPECLDVYNIQDTAVLHGLFAECVIQ